MKSFIHFLQEFWVHFKNTFAIKGCYCMIALVSYICSSFSCVLLPILKYTCLPGFYFDVVVIFCLSGSFINLFHFYKNYKIWLEPRQFSLINLIWFSNYFPTLPIKPCQPQTICKKSRRPSRFTNKRYSHINSSSKSFTF